MTVLYVPAEKARNLYGARIRPSGANSGRGTARAEDAHGTPTQSHISPSILVYEEKGSKPVWRTNPSQWRRLRSTATNHAGGAAAWRLVFAVRGFDRNVKRFRGGLVFKARRWLYHSTLGSRVIKKKKKALLDGHDPRGGAPWPVVSCCVCVCVCERERERARERVCV